MENNNGRGVFYGVIGVATLIVTIIGATFAYFNASTNSAENEIQTASSAVTSLSLNINPAGRKENLIPADDAAADFGTLAGIAADKCKDPAGNYYCSIYTFTITNPNAQAQPIYVDLEPKTNGFGNLSFALFKGTPADGAYTVTGEDTKDGGDATKPSAATTGQLVIKPTKLTGTNKVRLDNITQLLGAINSDTASVTYTLIFWIDEMNTDQNSSDANKTFEAGLRVSTGANAESGITAVLGASSK